MSGTAINTFTNGSTEEVSFTSMQQTILNAIKAQNNVSFINFASANTAALGVAAGSVLAVNFVLYRFDSNELFNLLNADDSITAYSAAADGKYYIVARPSSDGTCTCYLRLISDSNVAFNVIYGGLYESGTQHRIIGGVTKSGTSFSCKWIQRVTDAATGLCHREYTDGYAQKQRIASEVVSLYSTNTRVDYYTDQTITLSNMSLRSSGTIDINFSARVFVTGSSDFKPISIPVIFSLVDTYNNKVISYKEIDLPHNNFGSDPTDTPYTASFFMQQGSYNLTMRVVPYLGKYNSIVGASIASVNVNIRNVIGLPPGEF